MGLVYNLKLFAICALCLVVCVKCRSLSESGSIAQVGDIRIDNDGGKVKIIEINFKYF